jgi:hypothetical protein
MLAAQVARAQLSSVIPFPSDGIRALRAARFRALAVGVRSSLFTFDERRTWREAMGC